MTATELLSTVTGRVRALRRVSCVISSLRRRQRLCLKLDDMIILLLGAPSKIPTLQDRLEGITRLEKLIFLLERETDYSDLIDKETEFHAYNFGPFSAQVYKAVGLPECVRIARRFRKVGSQ